jgi:hypothetical protein
VIAGIQDPIPQQAGDDFGNVERVHPVGLAALAVLILLALALPRRWSTLPLVLLLCFIPAGQRVLLFTLDLSFVRILTVATWVRLVARQEVRPLVWNRLDRLMLLWAATSVLTGTMLAATLSAFINRAGAAFDALAIYFLFRQRIRTPQDLAAIAGQFLVCSPAVLACFLYEHATTRNMFHVFGGVPEFTPERDGRLRCQGAFAHPILAGCFWACLVPFYCLRGWTRARWLGPASGGAVAAGIVALSASSTPVVALLSGLFAAACWQIRGALRWVRWLAVGALCALHCLMQQPVWHLLARIDLTGSSTGWHRFHLFDEFINHRAEWWWLGTPRTGHWGPGLHDVTNEYVAEAVAGGIFRLLLFLAILVTAFAGISRTMRLPGLPRLRAYGTWALGAALFMHCMNFVGVTYFEQIVVLWHLTLAAIGSLTLVPGAATARQLAAEVAQPATKLPATA